MRGERSPRLALAALAVLCLLAGGLGLQQAWADSPTFDEPIYVVAGLTALTRHDLRFNDQHPPLNKVISAVPVLFADPVIPGGRVWRHPTQDRYTKAFTTALLQTHKLREVTFLSRLVPLLELMLSGLVIYALARRIAGWVGGLFAAGMWFADPLVLGLGHVDGIDLPSTLAMLSVALALLRWWELRTNRRLIVLALACAAALLTRDTGIIAVLPALAVVAIVTRSWRQPLLVGAIVYACVWVVYLAFDPSHTLRHLNVLPARYLDGIARLTTIQQQKRPAFLIGHYWTGGRLWYWPVSVLVKLPAPLWLAYLAAPFWWPRVPRTVRNRALLTLAPPAVLITVATLGSPRDIGIRYLLPTFAYLAIAVAPIVLAWRPVAVVLLSASAAFTATAIPYSLAWTAPPFRPGYKVATDSSIDWGQDFYRLVSWARGKNPWVAYGDTYGIGSHQVPDARPLPNHAEPSRIHGWVAIGVTQLNTYHHDLWLKKRRPVGTLGGGSIVLYHLR